MTTGSWFDRLYCPSRRARSALASTLDFSERLAVRVDEWGACESRVPGVCISLPVRIQNPLRLLDDASATHLWWR